MARPFTRAVAAGESAEIGECLPEMHAERETNEVEVDLRNGALMTRPDSTPLLSSIISNVCGA